jgi:HEAT repeat protein
MGEEASPAVPQLIRLLKADSDSCVRMMAAQAFQRVGVGNMEVTSAMVQALGDKEPAVREMGAKSLGIAGTNYDVVIPALTKSLRDGSPKVREAAATALLRIAPEAAAKAGVQVQVSLLTIDTGRPVE